MFCDNCLNLMAITSNVFNDSDKTTIKTDSITQTNKYYEITEDDINNLLNNGEINFDITQESYNNLIESELFNSFDNNVKTKIINRLMDKLNKNKKNNKNIVSNKNYYFYCNNCGFNVDIKPQTLIYSNITTNIDNNFLNYKHDKTLPKTKNYTCVNEKCTTHKNPLTKEATFYRIDKTYDIRYICHICDSYW
jgi:hypothetical protein